MNRDYTTSCSQTGGTLVEFSFGIVVLITMIYGAMVAALFTYQRAALFHATNTAARQAITGLGDANLTRIEWIEGLLIERAKQYGILLTPEQIDICEAPTLDCTLESPGSSGGYFSITAHTEFDLQPLRGVPIQARVFAKNEPF